MEELAFALIGLAFFGCAIAGIAAFPMVLSLRRRVRQLEARLARTDVELRPRGAAERGATETPPPETAPIRSLPPLPEPRSPVPPISARPQEAPHAIPPRSLSRSLDEQLGTRWAVWIGGVALALGGVFLVRYSIEQGLLGPTARIAAGALFALALIAAGEWTRRRELSLNLPGLASAHIPSVLTAAGTLTAFATAYAAHALYGLIGPAAAFVLLGLIAILTMVAAALHGPALAGLGLAASLITPLLVSSGSRNLWPVVLYLVFAVGATYGTARLRLWRWLGLTAAAGALLWGLALAAISDIGPGLAHLVLQLGLAVLFLVADPHRGTADEKARLDHCASAVLFGFAFLAIVLLDASTMSNDLRPFLGGGIAIALLLSSLRFVPVAPAAAWAGLVAVGTLVIWPVAREIAGEPLTVYPGPFPPNMPVSLRVFLSFATVLCGLIGGLTLWRIERGRALPLRLAGWLAAAGVLTPLLCLIIAYMRVTALAQDLPFALAACGLALAFTFAAQRLRSGMTETLDGLRLAVGATASGALAALALGLTFALEKGMLTVAFALTGLGTAWIAARLALPGLRHAVAVIGVLVLARLVWDPTIVNGAPGSTPILNWLLWGYGVPAISFFAAARLLERGGRDGLVRFIESLSIVFAAFLVFFEIRHAVHGSITHPDSGHLEAGLVTTSALAFALVLVRANARRPDPVYNVGSIIFTVLSVGIAAVGLLLWYNPLLTGETVLGGAVINSLLAAYLLPALLAGGVALAARHHRPQAYVGGMAVLAFLLQLAYMMLEIRRIFQGPQIPFWLPTSESEQWSYSLALLVCGLIILGIGMIRNVQLLRLASIAYLALAVLKVFIIDLAELEGIMRALSFIGLGLTLIGIALVYQRLLARRPEDARTA